jgi:hypothetical protein
VVRKNWGYYATPSINDRLVRFGLRGVLTKNELGKLYLMLVEKGLEDEFEAYIMAESITLIYWIDSDEAARHLSSLFV